MTTQSIRIHTASSDETRRLGAMIGKELQGATVIGLTGDLGCGKTVFVQGLARGLAVPDQYRITSPSYTFINEYPGRIPLFHMDLYRITSLEELTDIGFDDIVAGSGVAVIEWVDRLPEAFLQFDMGASIDMTGDNTRTFRFFFYRRPGGNLIQVLKNNFNADEE